LDCLRELYNFDFTPVSGNENTVAVGKYFLDHFTPLADRFLCYSVEFGANVYRPSDLNLFFNSFRPDQVNNTPTLISVEGGLLPHFASEAKCSADT
jgi:tripeptidyl-peptidase-1